MSKELIHISAAGVVLVALIILSASGILGKIIDPLRNLVIFFQLPFVKILEKLEVFFRVIISLRELALENEVLSRQVEELSVEIAEHEKAKAENKFLREALGFQTQNRGELVPAEITAFDILNVSQTITIDRGRDDGVVAGDAVIAAKGILVAVVSEVFDSTSQAELLTSSAVAVNAEVLPTGASGIVRGEHGLGLLLDLVSHNDVIKEGDLVVTSGLGGGSPKNLLIGEIGKIISGGPELFQQASINPAADLRHNKIVYVLKR